MSEETSGSSSGSRGWRAAGARRAGEWLAWQQENRYKVGDLVAKYAPRVRARLTDAANSPRAQNLRDTAFGRAVTAPFAEGGRGRRLAERLVNREKWEERFVRPKGRMPEASGAPTWPTKVLAAGAAAGAAVYVANRYRQWNGKEDPRAVLAREQALAKRVESESGIVLTDPDGEQFFLTTEDLEDLAHGRAARTRAQAADPRFATAAPSSNGPGPGVRRT